MSKSLMSRISLVVDLKIAPTSNPWTIAYSSDANTLLVTLLHLMDDQWIIFALLKALARQITYPICNLRLRLLVNEISVKTINLRVLMSSWRKRRPWLRWFICHYKGLFNVLVSSSFGLITWAVNERSNAASGWDMVAMYAPRACCATYWSFGVTAFLILSWEFTKSIYSFTTINCRHWHCFSWLRKRLLSSASLM